MSEEREFLENLLCQRFNFFLVIFGAVIAGVVTATSTSQMLIVLWSGAIISLGLALTIFRAQVKLSIVFEELKKDQNHPVTITDNRARGPSVRWIVGYAIPAACTLFLFALLIAAYCGCLSPGKGA